MSNAFPGRLLNLCSALLGGRQYGLRSSKSSDSLAWMSCLYANRKFPKQSNAKPLNLIMPSRRFRSLTFSWRKKNLKKASLTLSWFSKSSISLNWAWLSPFFAAWLSILARSSFYSFESSLSDSSPQRHRTTMSATTSGLVRSNFASSESSNSMRKPPCFAGCAGRAAIRFGGLLVPPRGRRPPLRST